MYTLMSTITEYVTEMAWGDKRDPNSDYPKNISGNRAVKNVEACGIHRYWALFRVVAAKGVKMGYKTGRGRFQSSERFYHLSVIAQPGCGIPEQEAL